MKTMKEETIMLANRQRYWKSRMILIWATIASVLLLCCCLVVQVECGANKKFLTGFLVAILLCKCYDWSNIMETITINYLTITRYRSLSKRNLAYLTP